MTIVPRVRTPLLLTATLAASFALAACGSGEETSAPQQPVASSRPATSQQSPTSTPSSAPAPGSEAPAASTGPHGGRHKVGTLRPRLRTNDAVHLLDADRLPSIGGRAWALEAQPAEGAVGACQKTDLAGIGAVDAVSRTFTADDGLAATQVVARFADAKSAWRAHQVLTAWRDDCEERVKRAEIGPLTPITVHAGAADGYRGSFRARSAGLGILRSGDYLALVEVTAADDRYPSSWDPARVAVRRIARTF